MSEFEYLELITLYGDSVASHAMNFIGVMFAYLIAAQYVGDKLSHFQFAGITALYALFGPFPGIYAYESIKVYVRLSVEYFERYRPEESVSVFLRHGPELMLVLLSGCWFASVIFMIQARISKHSRR